MPCRSLPRAGHLMNHTGSFWKAVTSAVSVAMITVAAPLFAQQEGQETGGAEDATAQAGYGVYPDSIVFGQSAALTGPAQALGWGMKLGLESAFAEANREGGVGGRSLRLISRDDSYEPEAAVNNTRDLIEHGVFGMIGAVGTPTSSAAEPVASTAEVPYIGAFTGAGLLRRPDQRYVVNLRASYNQETEEMVARLVNDLGITRIAIFYQNDNYGLAGRTGTRAAMERRGMTLVAEERYMRNTLAVKRALLDLRDANPEAIIIIGAYAPVAEFIKWSRQIGLNSLFVNISFVGSNALLNELGPAGNGVVITQVVPFPQDTSVPVIQRYHRALEAFEPGSTPGFVSLEGYLAGRLVIEVLTRMAVEGVAAPTREAFLETIAGAGPIDLGGFVVEYGPEDNQGSDLVFLTTIRDGGFVPVTRLTR